jgi:Mrp family chromosome partitioning ATPase
MFEALKEGDAQLEAAEAQRFALRRAPEPESSEASTPEPDEDLELITDAPYIEVGPNRSVEASPGILDGPPSAPPRPKPRPADEDPVLAPPDDEVPRAVSTPDSRPMTISFRPAVPVEKPVSRPRLAPELIAYHCPEDPASARYGELLTALTRAAAGPAAAFLFTSARLDAGTTTVLLNLAITATRQGRRRVIVVDANTSRPDLGARLGIKDRPGLGDVLDGTALLVDAIQETEQINLFALTAGSRPSAGSPRLVARTLRSLVRELRRRFDLVLIDGPRWDGQPDLVAAGLACDAVYVVMPEAEAESPQTDQLTRVIAEQGVRLGGCVLTACTAAS